MMASSLVLPPPPQEDQQLCTYHNRASSYVPTTRPAVMYLPQEDQQLCTYHKRTSSYLPQEGQQLPTTRGPAPKHRWRKDSAKNHNPKYCNTVSCNIAAFEYKSDSSLDLKY